MADPSTPRPISWSRLLPRAMGGAWGLAMLALLVIAAREQHPVFSSRFECSSDPRDLVHPGEMLDGVTLRFIVAAHCSNARYVSDERIALRYVGAEVDVEMRPLRIGGEPYYRIVSVGDESMP